MILMPIGNKFFCFEPLFHPHRHCFIVLKMGTILFILKINKQLHILKPTLYVSNCHQNTVVTIQSMKKHKSSQFSATFLQSTFNSTLELNLTQYYPVALSLSTNTQSQTPDQNPRKNDCHKLSCRNVKPFPFC